MLKNIIPYGKHYIDKADIDAVIKTLKSDYLTQGPKINEFEKVFSNYVDAEYAIAVNNGTSALHLCALALGVKPGDKVICPTITFAASANCIKYCGGEVIFCDIDPETYLMDLNHVKKLFEEHKNITGVVSVDFAGRPVNLEILKKIANKYNAWIIQDSCHAPGAYFIDSSGLKQKCGNGFYADLAIFSFHPVKHIACGEGGMVTTNNKILAKKINLLRSHGITKDSNLFLNPSGFFENGKYPNWYYEIQELGNNYRLTDIQAALAISQLKKAKISLSKRIKIAGIYFKKFKNKEWIINQSGLVQGHAYHLYILQVKDRDQLYDYLKKRGINCQIHYFPIHLMPYYYSINEQRLDNSENYIKQTISIPIYPSISMDKLNYVMNNIINFYEG